MANVNTSFRQYIKDVTPGDYYYNDLFPARLADVRTDMKKNFPATSGVIYVTAKYIGSAAKRTMVTPVEDLDILVEFNLDIFTTWSYASNSSAFITRIRNAYSGTKTQVVGTRGQAIRVFYQKYGYVDLVPAVRVDNSTYKIPDGSGGWLYTSPERANQWFFDRHSTLEYRLKDTVKLLKKWNSLHSSRLKSFHLETMVAAMFTGLSYYQDLNIVEFFKAASNWLDVNDPGLQSGNLSSYLTYTQRSDVIQSFRTGLDRASEARRLETAGNHVSAITKWQWLFGDGFPY